MRSWNMAAGSTCSPDGLLRATWGGMASGVWGGLARSAWRGGSRQGGMRRVRGARARVTWAQLLAGMRAVWIMEMGHRLLAAAGDVEGLCNIVSGNGRRLL